MRKSLEIFLRYLLFWMIYFWISKLVFLLLNYELSSDLTFSEISKIFLIGSKMDLSMSCYLLILPGVFLALSFLYSKEALRLLLKVYTITIAVPASVLNVMDLALYPHWGTRIGINAFNYFGDMKLVMANVSFWNAIAGLAVFLFFLLLSIYSYNPLVNKKISKEIRLKWYYSPIMLFLTACLIIPIRGGLDTSPLNLSSVSFSEKLYANQASANYLWNFFNTVERRNYYTNPCMYSEKEKAWSTFNEEKKQRIYSDTILIKPKNNTPPNVIMIVLESFSNKILSSFGGQYNVCPNLDSLCNESIIFTSFYASGNRSDRGISALLGGYPSLLEMSIMRYPNKSDKLTLISDYFNRNGYHSSFNYGGDIDFYSLKSFVLQGEYADVTSNENFPVKLKNMSKWGVPDGYLLERVADDLSKKEEPFFSVTYTLSSHPPFDVPFNKIKGISTDSKYLNSVAYTDSCLGVFINTLKQSAYWDNTLLIITADHGALHPGSSEIIEPATYKIPMIWAGGVIEKPGVIDTICGQIDLIPTLVHQLGWEMDSTQFGHDLFSTPSYALYMHDSGWGFASHSSQFYFNRDDESIKNFKDTEIVPKDLDFAKAYLQVLHDDFLHK